MQVNGFAVRVRRTMHDEGNAAEGDVSLDQAMPHGEAEFDRQLEKPSEGTLDGGVTSQRFGARAGHDQRIWLREQVKRAKHELQKR